MNEIKEELLTKLIEIHKAAGSFDWDKWMDNRSIDWYDEVDSLFNSLFLEYNENDPTIISLSSLFNRRD